jgi:NTP pyrophosphatase (non-canonical NTP hydrolase)
MTYTLQDFSDDIAFFNEACGVVSYDADSKPEDVYNGILRQYHIIAEELEELHDAAQEGNEQEMLDAVVDVLYTSLRLVSLLEGRYNVMAGCKAVAENNALKYTTSKDRARQWQMTKMEQGMDCNLVETDVFTGYDCGMEYDTYYCIKNANGKVMKYEGFPKVDLSVMLRKEV